MHSDSHESKLLRDSSLASNPTASRKITLVLAVGVCSVALGCGLADSPAGLTGSLSEEDVAPLKVNVAQATLIENVFDTSISFGKLEARRSSSLAFARGGRVERIFADVGDMVAEGTKIAELDQGALVNQQEELDRELATKRSQLSAFQARRNQTQASSVQREITDLIIRQEQLAREFANGYVVAPYRGVIVERNVNEGDAVPGGRPFFRIIEDAQPIVRLDVPTTLATQIKFGEEVWVKSETQVLQAKVATISPEVSPSSRTRSLTLDITTDDENVNWTYGETIEAQFWIATENSGYWLPFSALQREASGLWSAFVLETDGERQIVRRRILELVQLEDTHALVRGSINEGDLYIVDGLNRVVPGQWVEGNLLSNDYQQAGPPGAVE